MRESVSRVVVVAASPRTGSNLLCYGLGATGVVGDPREHLNAVYQDVSTDAAPWSALTARGAAIRMYRRAGGTRPRVRPSVHHLRTDRLMARIRQVATDHCGPDGTFATKLMWGQYHELLLSRGHDVDIWGAPVEWVHVRRIDTWRQAVSWLRAIQSGEWVAGTRTPAAIRYDRERLVALEQQARREEANSQRYFGERGISPIEVTYEALEGDYAGTLRSVLDALGYPGVPVPPEQTRRMADETSDAWLRRLRDGGPV